MPGSSHSPLSGVIISKNMDPAAVTTIMNALGKALSIATKLSGWKKQRDKEKQKQVQIALASLLKAARETHLYFAKQRDAAAAETMSSPQIADLWSHAAQDMWPVDPDAGQLLALKMEFWLDPEGWDEGNRKNIDIQLDKIIDRGMKALKG